MTDTGSGAETAAAGPRPAVKLTPLTPAAMVAGSTVGAGVFSPPRRFATETGVAVALIAWAIAGVGMLPDPVRPKGTP
ncbi:hypothetical protein [Streptomyces sp. NPDC093149]|uniref:hypothetical protein n=1 Tax=Streptomyces sp. NPDC093149 TaxID=3366031 RepID=UPI00382D4626